MSIYFDLAKIYDREDNTTIRQEAVLKLTERSIFDPLLGDAVYSRFDFQEQLGRGNFSEVIVFDLKFIKEINEGMSYADADESIIKLWKNIKSNIKESERSNIYISRFGGSFMLGVKTGRMISLDTRNALQKLGSKMTQIFSQNTKDSEMIPVGFSAWKTSSKSELKVMLKYADDVFFIRLFDDIVNNEIKTPGFIDQLLDINLDNMTQFANYHTLSKIELYAKFLRGKRSHERTDNLLKVSASNSSMDIVKTLVSLPMNYEEGTADSINMARKKTRECLKKINMTALALP